MQIRNSLWYVLLSMIFIAPIHSQTLTIDERLALLSLEQKVGQMFVMSFFGADLNFAAQELLRTWQPGAIVLLPSNLENPAQITQLTNDIQQTLIDSGSIPAFIAVDQEGGIIAHLDEGFTTFPVPSLLTATQNIELAHQFGQALASEMLAVGINMNLAPVADLQTNLDNPIIGRRSFGNDPNMVAPVVAAVIQGMQDTGVMATVKHFPGHGDTHTDSHLELPVLNFTETELMSRELIPFQAAIEAETGAVMIAHIYFPAIDSEDERPASLSANIIEVILREGLNYDGIVITDALDMDAIDTVYSPSSAALHAITAGNDLILLGAHISPESQASAMQAVVDAVHAGDISEERIDQSVRRILEAKVEFGIFDWHALEPNSAQQRINITEYEYLVREMFVQGITLVSDENALMPLSDNTLIIYPGTRNTLGTTCSHEGWQSLAVSLYPTDDDSARAEQAANIVDAVVVFTENVQNNPQQVELVNRLPSEKTIVVALWSPFDNLYLPHISTYFVTYSPLSQAYSAICDILHGEAQPQGTLSLSLEPQ